MAGISARRQPKLLNPARLAKLIKEFIKVCSRNEVAKEELGAYVFKEMFESTLAHAINFRYNETYLHLCLLAGKNALGPVTPQWIKTVLHTDTMGRVLAAQKMDDHYKILSYSHRARFVGIGFSHADFVAGACLLAVTGEWPVVDLGSYLRNHTLRADSKKLTPAIARRTLRRVIKAVADAEAVRKATGSTYRQMLKYVEPEEFVTGFVTRNKDLARFVKDVEAENTARQKKSKRRVR